MWFWSRFGLKRPGGTSWLRVCAMLQYDGVHMKFSASNDVRFGWSKTLERLTTAYRINSAQDDPAGSAIADMMKADVAMLGQSSRNLMDGISMAQTSEGSLSSIAQNLADIKSLSTQHTTGTYSPAHKKIIKDQLSNLIDSIKQTAGLTEFNGIKLLDSDGSIEISAGDGETISVSTKGDLVAALESIDIETDPEAFAAAVNAAIENVSEFRGTIGAQMNRLETSKEVQDIRAEMTLSAQSRIEDADIAREAAKETQQRVMMQSGIAMQAHTQVQAQMVLQLLG